MSIPAEPAEPAPPPRFLLRPAGVLVQLSSVAGLLVGTIAFVLLQQQQAGGAGYVIAWAVAAMAGLVFGGLMSRGGLVSVLAGAGLVAIMGTVLLVIDYPTIRSIVWLLPEADAEMIADVLVAVAIVMVGAAALSLASIPQARRYHRALREAEHAYEEEQAASSASMAAMAAVSGHVPATSSSGQLTSPRPQVGASWHVGAAAHRESAAGPIPRTRPGIGGVPVDRGSSEPISTYVPSAASTARGWQPSRAYTTMMLVRTPAASARSRRRMYFALGGLAIGVGIGTGVLLSSTQRSGGSSDEPSSSTASSSTEATGATASTGSATGAVGSADGVAAGSGSGSASGSASHGAGSAGSAGGSDAGSAVVVAPATPVRDFLTQQRAAIGRADARALAATASATVIGFGPNADEVIEGRAAYEAMALAQFADTPPDGFKVTSRYLALGEHDRHAWIAEELELGGGGLEPRRIAITQLVAFVGGSWTTVAVHWAHLVPDATAERRAILGTLPRPGALANQADGGGDLAAAVRAAFASRAAFAEARSERDDGFNYGSGPGERIRGGTRIKQLFGRLRSQLRIVGPARVVTGSVWDPAQRGQATIGVAALNVEYTQKSRAATELTQTFRVLAVFLREGDAWTIVQTQFSHGGPI